MILQQVPQHIFFIEKIKAKTLCYFFDDNNCAVKLSVDMINDFLREYEINQDMMQMLQH